MPLPDLDLRTLIMMAGMTSLAMGFVLLMLRRHYPGSIRGMWLWGLAPLAAAASTLFYGLDRLLPDLLVVIFGNGLLMTACALFYFGSRRFHGLRSGWRPWAVAGMLVLLWHVVFLQLQPDYRLRLAMFTIFLSAVLLAHVRLLLRRGRGFAARFTASVLALQAVLLVVRGVATFWIDQPDTYRLAPSAVQSAYVAAYSFSVLLVSVGVLLMASERLRTEFEQLARQDSLTGALTRHTVLQAARHEFGRWRRYDHGLSLLMLDVDHFKQVNDRHGHLVGDRTLQAVVQALRRELRTVDLVGRYGGEEFLVLLPQTGLEAARCVAERMRQRVAQRPAVPGLPACTISVGLAAAEPGDTGVEAALARADAALYQAKRLGRNRVETDSGAGAGRGGAQQHEQHQPAGQHRDADPGRVEAA